MPRLILTSLIFFSCIEAYSTCYVTEESFLSFSETILDKIESYGEDDPRMTTIIRTEYAKYIADNCSEDNFQDVLNCFKGYSWDPGLPHIIWDTHVIETCSSLEVPY